MKALSLWQPWASAIASGEKRLVTRSWMTNYRGYLAIHAANRWTFPKSTAGRPVAWPEGFGGPFGVYSQPPEPMPLGVVVATCVLSGCCPTWAWRGLVGERELELGDFSDGRWCWLLTDVVKLPVPIPFCGRQGLFDIPDELLKP